MIDASGRVAAHTGSRCIPSAGNHVGEGYSVQANLMDNDTIWPAMAKAFEAARGDLAERMLQALEAAQAAGGDMRGRQSAALYVVDKEEYPLVDLRVDEHPYPVAELRRVFEIAKHQLFPFLRGLPNRQDQQGNIPKEVADMLLTPPPNRPGGGGSAPDPT